MGFPKEFELLATPEGNGIVAELDDFGVLSFVVKADAGSSVRGTEMFNRMMSFFGDEVRIIHGVWRKNPTTGDPSINIDKVNELTAQGVSLTDAILKAWTVTRAAKWSFTKTRVVRTPVGMLGGFTELDIFIEKVP